MSRYRLDLTIGSLIALICIPVVSGCVANSRRDQLDRVAKDWCETIRAAQIVPVFPLTQDLHPGDVFLVRSSLAEQRKEFAKGGPLPLDDHRVRLGRPTTQPTTRPAIDYSLMYFDGYFKDPFGRTPHERVARAFGDVNPFIERMPAPAASFPVYTFEVKAGSSANLAIPIQGVPVALSFMQTGNATGSVQLQDAFSYGADPGQVYDLLSRWAEDGPNNRALEDAVRNNGGRPVFLRVVTRVFLVGGVAVSLFNQEVGGAGAAAQLPAIPIFDSATGQLNENYAKLLDHLGARASDERPTASTRPTTASSADESAPGPLPAPTSQPIGGNVKFTGAGQRTVSLDERFARPLIVGYLGFDVPVYSGGVLGHPLPTWTVLTGRVAPPSMTVSELSPAQRQAMANLDWLLNPANHATRFEMMRQIIRTLGNPKEYAPALEAIDKAVDSPDDVAASHAAQKAFEHATLAYLDKDLTYTVRSAAFQRGIRTCLPHRGKIALGDTWQRKPPGNALLAAPNPKFPPPRSYWPKLIIRQQLPMVELPEWPTAR